MSEDAIYAYQGYELADDPVVKLLGTIDFTGDTIPAPWFHFIKNEHGKAQTNAVLVLGRLVYWHRPIQAINPVTQQAVAWRKKYAGRFYQMHYREYANYLGITEREVRAAMKVLRSHGLLHLHLCYEEDARRGTAVYVQLMAERIVSISHRPEGVTASDLLPRRLGKVFRYSSKEEFPPPYSRSNVSSPPPTDVQTSVATHVQTRVL